MTVKLGCVAGKLITEENKAGGGLRVTAVEITTSKPTPQRWTVIANKEVILSAGVVATPQILLLSGIGPRTELEKHGIPVVKENDHVGRNLRDVSSLL